MSFTTGFTGGVVVTLGLAYLTLNSHQRTRETQSQILRAQATILDKTIPQGTRRCLLAEEEYQRSLQPPSPDGLPRRQPHLVETAKERWNREVMSIARWVQRTDWNAVREDIEDNVAQLVGGAVAADEKAVNDKVRVMEKAAKDVKEGSKEQAGWLWASAKAEAEDVKKEIKENAQDAKESVFSKAKEGLEAGKSLLGRAKESVAATMGGAVKDGKKAASDETPVQKALKQRYEKSDALGKTVRQALEERYVPSDKRDNTALRGI